MIKYESFFNLRILVCLFLLTTALTMTSSGLHAQQIPAAWTGPLPDVGLEFETHSYELAVEDMVNAPKKKVTIEIPKDWKIVPVSAGFAAIDNTLAFDRTGKEYRYQFVTVSKGFLDNDMVPVEGEHVVSSQIFDYGPFKIKRTQTTPYGNKQLHTFSLTMVYHSLRFNIGIEVLEEHNHLHRIAILERIARSVTVDGKGVAATAADESKTSAKSEAPAKGNEPPPVSAPEKEEELVDKRSVNGTWESAFGPITFAHEKITSQKTVPVKGTRIHNDGGEFTGTYHVTSGLIKADYKGAWVSGKITWKMSEDGLSLKGEYIDNSGKSEWDVSRELVEDNSSELSLNDEWKSNFGKLRIKHGTIGSNKKVKIVGYWGEKPSQGNLTGEYDVENGEVNIDFFQPWNNEKGTAKWKLSADRKQLNGTYDQGASGSGNWNLSR